MSDPFVQLLRSRDCCRLLDRLRKKMQRGQSLTGRIRLNRLTESERRKVSELTGSQSTGDSLTVDLAVFSQIVANTGRFASLAELVVLAHGSPIADHRARRQKHLEAWDRVWVNAERHANELVSEVDCEKCPAATTISAIKQLRHSGWLKRTTKSDPDVATALLDQVFELLKLLPTAPVPLAIFAAIHTGDAHSLDSNRPLGKLMLKLITPIDTVGKEPAKRQSALRRSTWESVGIVLDELSSSALVLNLPARGNSLTDDLLRTHADAGMPCRLTFRHLRLAEPTFPDLPEIPGSDNAQELRRFVFVCENPGVIAAAAERFASSCPPMICTEGHPTLACWSLLQQLVQSGYQIRYHGDFDWGGIRIANKIYMSFGFTPWRFSAADHGITSDTHRKLRPPETDALWDDQLASKIRNCGVSVEEESVTEDLLYDLQNVIGSLSRRIACSQIDTHKPAIPGESGPHNPLWLPYTQMKTAGAPLEVASTEGVRICLRDGRTLVDGIASWWTACHGYNHPAIVDAIQSQAAKMPHVMMGGLVHEPAKQLAESLADLLPGDRNKVFFVDSGSVAAEVAMKMAVQFWRNRSGGASQKNHFVCFQDSYHGDTTGAMSVCDPVDSMHAHFKGFLLEQFPQPIPNDEHSLAAFKKFLSEKQNQVAGVIIEPLVQMAAGMRFHSPTTLRGIFEVCRELDLIFIADEVATGFGRTGSIFAFQQADIEPDIVCVGKGLTGCSVGLAATIATGRIYDAFHSDDPAHCLMHGPTFMGNPIACAAANASLKLFESEPRRLQVAAIEAQLQNRLRPLQSFAHVNSVHCLGAIGAVRMKHSVGVQHAIQFFVDRGVWIRPLRDTVYLAPAFTISEAELDALCDAIEAFISMDH